MLFDMDNKLIYASVVHGRGQNILFLRWGAIAPSHGENGSMSL